MLILAMLEITCSSTTLINGSLANSRQFESLRESKIEFQLVFLRWYLISSFSFELELGRHHAQEVQSACCTHSPSLLAWPPARHLAVHKYRDPSSPALSTLSLSFPLPSPALSKPALAAAMNAVAAEAPWPPHFSAPAFPQA